ncbi:MAG: DUF3800 domain-containing protein [Candidatus Eremiobacteraeota bacterium]|nr:DUF3800 domain-containing protein [Candidatus Eremiobacteraeota bacterium]
MPTLYAYIDETGDEGYPKFGPHTDVLAYRDRSTNSNGPSPFFMMCGVLVKDTDRSAYQRHIRALSNALFPASATPDKEIHWRDLDWERKQHAIEVCCQLDFTWVGVVAYKPAMTKRLSPPYLYNWCTRLLLERLIFEASASGCDLVPVFSNRARTDYVHLQRYVSSQVHAFGKAAGCLKPIRTQQSNKERLLQLVDVCAGSLHNALEVNNYGKLQSVFLGFTAKKFARHASTNMIWGSGLKFIPDDVGTNFGPPTKWIDAARKS